jgi:hypothetical protein
MCSTASSIKSLHALRLRCCRAPKLLRCYKTWPVNLKQYDSSRCCKAVRAQRWSKPWSVYQFYPQDKLRHCRALKPLTCSEVSSVILSHPVRSRCCRALKLLRCSKAWPVNPLQYCRSRCCRALEPRCSAAEMLLANVCQSGAST